MLLHTWKMLPTYTDFIYPWHGTRNNVSPMLWVVRRVFIGCCRLLNMMEMMEQRQPSIKLPSVLGWLSWAWNNGKEVPRWGGCCDTENVSLNNWEM